MPKLNPKPFELNAGNAALDLINTLDNRFDPARLEELLPNYEALLRFAHQSQLISERQFRKLKRHPASPAERTLVLDRTLALRESLSTVLYALVDQQEPPTASLEHLEALFKEAASHLRLAIAPLDASADEAASSSPAPAPLTWAHKGISREIQSPLWLLAQSANNLITSPEIASLRTCASPACRWLFLDTSKNHTRRWCDMRICGNRNKARQFQLRQHPAQ